MNSGASVVWRGRVEVVVEGELEVPAAVRERVDRLWEEARAERPQLHDGRIVVVRDVDSGVVRGAFAPYRLFLARERDAELRRALGLRAIGVSGVLRVGTDGVAVGRRASGVTEYPGCWELVPSGGVGVERVAGDGQVDTLGVLLDELAEEVGLAREDVIGSRPLGLLHDAAQDGYDVCIELETLVDPARISGHRAGEYDELRVSTFTEAASLLRERPAVPTSETLLELAEDRP